MYKIIKLIAIIVLFLLLVFFLILYPRDFAIVFAIAVALVILKEVVEYRNKKQKEKENKQLLEEEMRQSEEKRNEELAQIKSLLHYSPADYFSRILENKLNFSIYDEVLEDGYSCNPKVDAILRDGILGVDCLLPNKDEISRVKEVYYLKNGDERERLYSERDFAKVYERDLYLLTLKSIESLFESDDDNKLTGILFNGIIQDYSPTTGQLERKVIMSVYARKEQFDGIDLEHVDPKACFKSLKGVSAAKLGDIKPVSPVLVLDKEDKRFIKNQDVSTNSGTNLASMDWQEFEQLVRQVLEMEFGKNGGEVKVTQASRDGGVDAVIFDPDPLRGGKIIVQAKRYTNTVPVSAVRDLYGSLINEGASSGILITTSDFGPDSYDFAKDKPLKLLNSGHLLGLLQKNGMQGYIDLDEAKRVLKES